MRSFNSVALACTILVLALALTCGCAPRKAVNNEPPNLPEPMSAKTVAEAITYAERGVIELDRPFEAMYEQVVRVAAENPSNDNDQIISKSVDKLLDGGRITSLMRKKFLNSYFSNRFIALVIEDVRIVEMCDDYNLRRLIEELRDEYCKKYMGLMRCHNDDKHKKLWESAQVNLAEFREIIMASCGSLNRPMSEELKDKLYFLPECR